MSVRSASRCASRTAARRTPLRDGVRLRVGHCRQSQGRGGASRVADTPSRSCGLPRWHCMASMDGDGLHRYMKMTSMDDEAPKPVSLRREKLDARTSPSLKSVTGARLQTNEHDFQIEAYARSAAGYNHRQHVARVVCACWDVSCQVSRERNIHGTCSR